MYPAEPEINDTTESNTFASYLDLILSIGRDGQLHTSICDKPDDFNFHITNFPFLSSNIPTSTAYGVFISQLKRYTRAYSSYWCFILSAMRLSNKLLEQGYVKERLKSSLRKIYGRNGDLIKQYVVPLSRMLNDILGPDHIQWLSPTDKTFYRTRPFTEIWEVSIEHLWRVWHTDRGRLLLRTPGPVLLGLAYVLLVETNPFPERVVIFPDYALRISLGTFSIFLVIRRCTPWRWVYQRGSGFTTYCIPRIWIDLRARIANIIMTKSIIIQCENTRYQKSSSQVVSYVSTGESKL